MTVLHLRGIRKVHPGGHVAVDGVDLEVASGEFFVLLGPSGCGKTTLLRLIAGLDHPTGGQVWFDGAPVDVPTNRRGLAMMFQSSALYPHMSVRENLAFPLVLAKCRPAEIERRVASMARLLGVSELLDRRPSRLSGGQQQRVAMGRALIRRPQVLLLDEPMSNLDAALRTELRSELARLHRRFELTSVYVTHDQVEAMALADRVAVMRDGRVVQCGSPHELYARPVDVFVAGFLGAPPMNLLAGTVVATPRGVAVRVGSHVVDLGCTAVAPGRRVVVGFRPEDVRLVADGPLTVEAVHVERLGHEDLVHLRIDADACSWHQPVSDGSTATLYARIDRRGGAALTVDPWRPMGVAVGELHLFDAADGRSIGVVEPSTVPAA